MNTTEITKIKGLAERKKNVLCICTKSLVNEYNYKCEDGNDGAEKIVVWWKKRRSTKTVVTDYSYECVCVCI